MDVKILRGENKIGENLIEITTKSTRILLECGKALEETTETKSVENRVLKEKYDAIFISHSHLDHAGLLTSKACANSIYMGEDTFKLLSYNKSICEENIPKIVTFKAGEEINVGDCKITAHLCDHSCFDSFMFEIKTADKTILYTGDFRSHGRKSFDKLLCNLPKNIDILICENTNGQRLSTSTKSEYALQKEAEKIMAENSTVYIMQASTNIDRLVSFYKASTKTQHDFIMQKTMSEIAGMLKNIPNPAKFKNCYLCVHRKITKEQTAELKNAYNKKFISYHTTAKMPKISMLVSSSSLGVIKKLTEVRGAENAVLIYSMWGGYKTKSESVKNFLKEIENLGIKIVNLHTSGHADSIAISKIKNAVNPQKVVYVHGENKGE
ncbi:MAG: MBL fold metallo-hydrolase [Bacillota bacterium]